MFERYTEKLGRVIFFARYEASQFGSPCIETEHLLLGLLREDKALTHRFLGSHADYFLIRKQIEGHSTVRERISTSVDMPFSNEGKRVLAYAAEEAEGLSQAHIGTEHLLFGILREERCFAAELLHEKGLRLATVRDELRRPRHSPFSPMAWQRDDDISNVTITSSPPGAGIEIDGDFLGNTPAELPFAPGEQTIRLAMKGYKPWERKLTVLARSKQTLIAELEREEAQGTGGVSA